MVQAENESYPHFVTVDGHSGSSESENGDFFKATIWAEGTEEKTMVLPLDSSFRFDLQFGRRVLAKLLALESRMQWQDCSQTEVEETTDAEAFKAAFKAFDFTLEE